MTDTTCPCLHEAVGWPHGDALVALVTLLLFIATVASVVATWQLGKRQESLQKEIAAVSKDRAENQRKFDQRSHLIPVWNYIASLSDIDPDEMITPDIIDAANTLELVAVCCEAGILDESVVMRTFGAKYMDFYEKIERCGPLPGCGTKTGNDLLKENRAAVKLYRKLENEQLNSGSPIKLET